MKKIVLFVAVVSAFSFASCKKDRSCTCTYTDATTSTQPGFTAPASTPSTVVVLFTKTKKGDAQKACVSRTTTDVQTMGTYTYTTVTTQTCDLK